MQLVFYSCGKPLLLAGSAGGGTAVIYGRDIVTGLPVERTLNHDFVTRNLEEGFRIIVDNVRQILERTPPELSADIYRNGLFMTGGACQEEGLATGKSQRKRLTDLITLK